LTVALAIANDTGWRGRLGRTGRALLSEGLPTKADYDAVVADRFAQLRAAGADRGSIASELGVSDAAMARLVDRASSRWGYRDVTRALGWSPDNLRLRRRTGSFPSPHGTDRGRDWWWPATVDAWTTAAGLRPCPDCGALVAKLPQHRRAHADRPRSD
jgi:hypothetical protein